MVLSERGVAGAERSQQEAEDLHACECKSACMKEQNTTGFIIAQKTNPERKASRDSATLTPNISQFCQVGVRSGGQEVSGKQSQFSHGRLQHDIVMLVHPAGAFCHQSQFVKFDSQMLLMQ